MKILIIGANGQLGSDMVKLLKDKFEVIPLTDKDIDIGDEKNQKDVIIPIKPDIIVNCAAYTNVPDCEINKQIAFNVNGYALKELSIISNKLNSHLIHFSTDYVFDGLKKKPYIESDFPNPLNTYGISKYVGEIYVKNYCKKYSIIRVSGLYGINPSPLKKNFIEVILSKVKKNEKIEIVDDQFLTPTWTYYVAKQTLKIIEHKIEGIIHSTCEGETNWYEFAKAIFEILGINVNITPVKTKMDEFVKRPLYSVLENSVLKNEGINIMPHWKDALKEYLKIKFG
uniref:dTDP-4-dehydrorhamnose reductase n=1 Tax=candidate division WOR-3 bacterium TaxID=2052148 RepID=A0A7C4YHQ3_UNCW3